MTRSAELTERLSATGAVRRLFVGPVFHETVLALDRSVAPVLAALAARGIQGGLDLGEYYPELGPALLVCATETKSTADIEAYARALAEALPAVRAAWRA
jgi:glycine dehydrogenase subunit 1